MLLLMVLKQDLKDLGGTLAGLDLSERCATLTEKKTQKDENIILYAFQSPFTSITSFRPRDSCMWQRVPRYGPGVEVKKWRLRVACLPWDLRRTQT